jgi:hypothetical protein
VPLIVPARAQNDMLPQSICRRIRKVIPIQLDLLRVIHFSLLTLPSDNGEYQAHLCVCFLEHRLIVRRHTVICEERRYHIDRITPAERISRWTLESGWESCLTYVPKLELRDPMRDRTITRLWYLRSKQILNLSGRSTRIVIILLLDTLEICPICNQDRNADACGIPRAGVPYKKGLP